MESAAPSSSSSAGKPRIGYFLIALAGALVVGLIYYGVGAFKNSTFNNARAFRVLGEISEQFQNLQISFDGLLRNAPSACTPASAQMDECLAYQRRLDFDDVRVVPEPPPTEVGAALCDSSTDSKTSAFLIDATDPNVPFYAIGCDTEQHQVRLESRLRPILERFIAQSFFDEAVIALGDGRVLAEIPRREQGLQSAAIQLQEPKVRTLSITDAAPLLKRAAAEIAARAKKGGEKSGGEETGADKSEDDGAKQRADKTRSPRRTKPGLHPVAFSEALAGQSYDVYISGVSLAHPLAMLDADEPDQAAPVSDLYLIGIKRSDLRAQITTALGPGGGFVIATLLAVTFFAFPLLSLRLKSRQDPIRWSEAAGCTLSAMLLATTLAAAVFWLWSYHSLARWADRGAETYAREISRTLTDALSESATLLYSYVEPGTHPAPVRDPALKRWSPLRSSALADVNGALIERFTAYAAAPVKIAASIADRQYFKALVREQQWTLPAIQRTPSGPLELVAQRLFNRGDGARVLQIAAPLKTDDGAFDGIITGDTRVHALTAAVTPLMLRFAVVDADGAVVFHSDDSRSLTENFFVETEDKGVLRYAFARREREALRGAYGGQPHRFHYAPVEDTPWGVFVFYPTPSLTEMASYAALSGLVAYAGALLVILIAPILICAAIGKERVARLLSPLWPRRGGEKTSLSYATIMTGLLLVCAALPTAWLSLRYHDAQVEGLLRDGLNTMVSGIERRVMVIAYDLQRWQPDASIRKHDLPDPWVLATHRDAAPSPGFRHGCDSDLCDKVEWAMTAFGNPPVMSPDRRRENLAPWMHFIWTQIASSPTQRRRAALVDAPGASDALQMDMHKHSLTAAVEWRPEADVSFAASTARPYFDTLAAALAAGLALIAVAALIGRRVFGAHIKWDDARSAHGSHSGYAPVRLYLNRRDDGETALTRRCGRNRINLLTDSRFEGHQSPRLQPGAYVLAELDLALIESRRRRKILDVLEGLVARDDVELIVTARRSPFDWLYHAELYPGFRPDQRPDDAELVRWDAVLTAFQFRWDAGAVSSKTHAMASHHQVWKLCTREERLVLYHLATHEIANPQNEEVIRQLVREGLVCVNSRPTINDDSLAQFVRTAEPTREIARWQSEASQTSWMSIRRPILVSLFALVLIVVIWFSWTGGEAFKVFSTVLMGAVALLGHMTNAFSFVRAPAPSAKA